MAKYKVLGKEIENLDESAPVEYAPVELTGKRGTFKWDRDSVVTELQVNPEQAEKLVEEGLLEVIEE